MTERGNESFEHAFYNYIPPPQLWFHQRTSQSPLNDLLIHSLYQIRLKKTPVFLTYKINTSSIAFFWGRNISTPREVCLYMMLFPQIKRISFLMGVGWGGGEKLVKTLSNFQSPAQRRHICPFFHIIKSRKKIIDS